MLELKTSPKLVLSDHFEPLTYKWEQQGANASRLEIDFQKSPARASYRTVTGEEDLREFEFPKTLVVLDESVIHHYQVAANLYRLAGGRKQTFTAFIPQAALPGSLTIEDRGQESIEVQGREARLRHLVVTGELRVIDVWVNDDYHLQRLSISEAQLEAVREKEK